MWVVWAGWPGWPGWAGLAGLGRRMGRDRSCRCHRPWTPISLPHPPSTHPNPTLMPACKAQRSLHPWLSDSQLPHTVFSPAGLLPCRIFLPCRSTGLMTSDWFRSARAHSTSRQLPPPMSVSTISGMGVATAANCPMHIRSRASVSDPAGHCWLRRRSGSAADAAARA